MTQSEEVIQDPIVVQLQPEDCRVCQEPLKSTQKIEECDSCPGIFIHSRKKCADAHASFHGSINEGMIEVPHWAIWNDQFQPREETNVSEEFLESIKSTAGNIEPVTLAIFFDKLVTVIGHHRVAACQQLQLPVNANIVRKPEEDCWKLAVTSNTARNKLTLYEEITSLHRLRKYVKTHRDVANLVGKNLTRCTVLLTVAEETHVGFPRAKDFIGRGADYSTFREAVVLAEHNLTAEIIELKLEHNWNIKWMSDYVSLISDYRWLKEEAPELVWEYEDYMDNKMKPLKDPYQLLKKDSVYETRYTRVVDTYFKDQGHDVSYYFEFIEKYPKSIKKRYLFLKSKIEEEIDLIEFRKPSLDLVDEMLDVVRYQDDQDDLETELENFRKEILVASSESDLKTLNESLEPHALRVINIKFTSKIGNLLEGLKWRLKTHTEFQPAYDDIESFLKTDTSSLTPKEIQTKFADFETEIEKISEEAYASEEGEEEDSDVDPDEIVDDLALNGPASEVIADLGEKREAAMKILVKKHEFADCKICGTQKKINEFDPMDLNPGIDNTRAPYLAGRCKECKTKSGGVDPNTLYHKILTAFGGIPEFLTFLAGHETLCEIKECKLDDFLAILEAQ